MDENAKNVPSSVRKNEEGDQALSVATERKKPMSRLYFLSFRALLQIVVSFAVLYGGVSIMNYLVVSKPEVPVRPKREQSFTVVTRPISIGENRPTISLYGEVVTNREVQLRSLVGGEIKSVSPNLRVGEFIDAGSEIATIDEFNYTGAVREATANKLEAQAKLDELEYSVDIQRTNIASGKEQLELAERDLERAKKLVESGNATDQSLDNRRLTVSQRSQNLSQLESNLKVAEAKVTQQKASLERLDWRLKQAQKNLENTVLLAPFDAVVKTQNAEVGRLVGVNDVLATLYDRNSLGVRFTLSDEQYGRLLSETGTLNGKRVTVNWFIGNQPRSYDAVVDRIGALVASNRGGVDVFAKINSEGADLLIRPGAFVQVHVDDVSYNTSAVIPEEAIYDGTHVFVKSSESRMNKREIDVHAFEGDKAYVTGQLQDGDILILTHIAEAGEGILVNEIGDPRNQSGRNVANRQQGASEGEQKPGQGKGKGKGQRQKEGEGSSVIGSSANASENKQSQQ